MTEFEKMTEFLDKAWMLRSEIVPCLVGPPGIGKTAAVEQHAEAHGCGKVVKIVASRCIPSETVGMTMPDHKNRSMEIYNSMQLSSLNDGDILFLDELLEAEQYVLSTLLTVIESREMADGTPLPDIQIIAATNDTIPPEQLKGNIRQRFMFMRFEIDREQTRRYIRNLVGINLTEPILDWMKKTSNDYNFLTPRSLTKLCLWMDECKDDYERTSLASVINCIYGSIIGTQIKDAFKARDSEPPEQQVRRVIRSMIADGQIPVDVAYENDSFTDCSMSEMLEVLSGLEEWDDIEKALSKIDLKEVDEGTSTDISF